MTQLSEVCRLCLIKSSKNSDELFFPIDEVFERKFTEITSISLLDENDSNFPKNVCISCVSELEKHFNYRNGLIDVQKRLYRLIGVKEKESTQKTHESIEIQKNEKLEQQTSSYVYEYVEEESCSQEECEMMENLVDDEHSQYESEIISFEEVINDETQSEMQEYLTEEDEEELNQTIDQTEEVENPDESIIYEMKSQEDYIIVNEVPDVLETPKKRKYTRQSKDAPKQYKCWMFNCNARFAFRATMKKHMLQLHSVECDRSTCLICGEKFDEYSDFLSHVKTHTRKAECEVCKLTFVNEEKMVAHRNRVHKNDTNERSFPCHVRFQKLRKFFFQITILIFLF
jgi:Zinc-finger associated domain (zf-AD)